MSSLEFRFSLSALLFDNFNTMGKTKETPREFRARMVREYPAVFRTDNSILFCKYCECEVTADKLSHVKQHIATKTHQSNVEKKDRPNSGPSLQQSLLTQNQQPQKINEFEMDFCKMFLEANIPLKKAVHPSVVQFFEKYTKKTLPSEFTLRNKYVPHLYDECMASLREKAKNKNIWVSIDETTDVEQRLVVNFIFGILDGDENNPEREKCYLLNMDVVEKANASSMAKFFNDSLLLLWPDGLYIFFSGCCY